MISREEAESSNRIGSESQPDHKSSGGSVGTASIKSSDVSTGSRYAKMARQKYLKHSKNTAAAYNGKDKLNSATVGNYDVEVQAEEIDPDRLIKGDQYKPKKIKGDSDLAKAKDMLSIESRESMSEHQDQARKKKKSLTSKSAPFDLYTLFEGKSKEHIQKSKDF